MLVRPIYLDIFWDYLFGRPFAESGQNGFAATQSDIDQAILNVAALQNAASLVCNAGSVAAASFTPGMAIVAGTPGSFDWQNFLLPTIVTDTLTVRPRIRTTIPSGAKVMGAWYNNAHVTTDPDQAYAFVSWLLNCKRAGRYGGANLLSRYIGKCTDANTEVQVPYGWKTGRTTLSTGAGTWLAPANAGEITMSTVVYADNNVAGSNTSDGNAFVITTTTTSNQGLAHQQAISVTAGKRFCLSWKARVTSNTFTWVVVDADDPAIVVATSPAMGTPGYLSYLVLGMTDQMVFTVPGGVRNLEVRIIGNNANSVITVDWVRLLEVDDDESGQYVLGSQLNKVAILGDSWGVQAATALSAGLATRGIEVVNNSQSGFRIDQLVAEFGTRVPFDSDACVLMASTNDIAQGSTVAQMVSRVASFCDECESAGIQPIVMGATPLGGASYDLVESNKRNTAMRDYVWNRQPFSVGEGATAAAILAAFKADPDYGTGANGMVTRIVQTQNVVESDPILEDVAGVQVLKTYERGTSTQLIPAKGAKQPGGADLTNPATQRLAGYRE